METPNFDIDLFNIPKDNLGFESERSLSEYIIILYKDDYDMHQDLVQKIFSAVNLDLNKYSGLVILERGEEINVSRHTSNNTKFVIAFGIAPIKLGLNGRFTGYTIYPTESFSLLLSHSLAQLSENKEKKKALWGSLRQAFGT